MLLLSFKPSRECAVRALKAELRITFQETQGSKLSAFDAVSTCRHAHTHASAHLGRSRGDYRGIASRLEDGLFSFV